MARGFVFTDQEFEGCSVIPEFFSAWLQGLSSPEINTTKATDLKREEFTRKGHMDFVLRVC